MVLFIRAFSLIDAACCECYKVDESDKAEPRHSNQGNQTAKRTLQHRGAKGEL